MNEIMYNYYAFLDLIVIVTHAIVLLFVVLGVALILLRSRNFVKNRLLRIAHLISGAYVVFTALIGIIFPIRELEDFFSQEAGGAPYPNLIASQWLQDVLGNPASESVFLLFFIFLAAVIGMLFKLRPPPEK